jgi:glycosyltransferase involved in cell wall biosynthesis
MTTPLITVITPFYNTERYLEECIASVLAQTWTNFEYLLVDNCSTDRSGEVAAAYAARDPRIRLLRNERHVGQVANYNGALRHVAPTSAYCKIVQADDWIFPTCLAQMADVAERYPSVGLVGAYTLNTSVVYLDGLTYPSTVVDGREISRRFLRDGLYVFGSPTATLVRSSIVRARAPFYEENNPVEDIEACLAVLREWDFGFVHQVLSYTRRDNESITSGQRIFNPLLLARYAGLHRHGRACFSSDQFGRCLRTVGGQYYRLLGEGALRRRPRAFWEYHRQGLGAVGESIHWARVGVHTMLALLDLVLNPKQTLERIWARVGRHAGGT